jgi:rare lipoprotein A
MIVSLLLILLPYKDTIGIASYYHNNFIGRKTSSGEVFSQHKMTAASNSYDLGTKVKVTNLENDSSIVVTINDRMGNKKRLIDLTKAGAKKLGFIKQGLTKVKIEVINESVVFRP